MLESGQPLHIFDYDALPEQKIVVRPAHQGEKLNALHGQELLLNSKDVVISSGEKVISLAGIIGSHETAITPQTKNILIECASFNPKLIKKTAKRLNISTAASHFFSRGANLVLTTQQVLARFILLIADNYQSDLNSKIFFSYQNQTAKKIPPIITITNIYYVTIPLSRLDITIPEDLLEELLRIYDYNKYHEYYRQTLVPSHLKTIKYNLARGNKDLFFFEISSVYGLSHNEELLILSGVVAFVPNSLNYLNSSQSAEIALDQEKIGFFGSIQPLITKKYQINEPVFIAEISLTKIFAYLNNYPPQFHYRPISNFPTSTKDLSFIFPESINYNEAIQEIRKVAGVNLQEVNIFDIYQSVELAKERKKSVGFHLIFQSPLKTLENKEIEEILQDIVARIEKLFAAKVRD
ncbi:10737_t:CDS:2 [Entrophospora sp. SA101]|nr:10737_t:CDS:2 [Entrophospora sp. SA101]